MRMFVSVLLCISMLFSHCSIAWGQSSSVKKTPRTSFSRGLVVKKDGAQLKGKKLRFESETLTFIDLEAGESTTLPLSEVDYVRARTGTHATQAALYGGLIFLAGALSAVGQLESDPYTEVDNGMQVVLLVTAIGVAGGLLIGAAIPKEKQVFKHNRLLAGHDMLLENPNERIRTVTLVSVGLRF